MTAITYGKKQNVTQKAAAVEQRLGPSMNGANPGFRPAPSSKFTLKPTRKGKDNGIVMKVMLKF